LFTLAHNYNNIIYSFDFGEVMRVTVNEYGVIESYTSESADYNVGVCLVENSYVDIDGPTGRFGHYSS
jgi:hypothetical protein